MLNSTGVTPQKTPFLTLRKVIFLLVPTLVWAVLFLLRPVFYTKWCGISPSPCLMSSMNAIDQIAFQYKNVMGDYYSNVVQNTAGVTAFLLLLILSRTEFYLLSLASMINVAVNEATHLLVQRPRPIVFDAPLTEGLNPDQYTSFYSGHTSFVAVATLCVFFAMRRLFPTSRSAHFLTFGCYLFLTTLTGILRVNGGRHFPTDVIAGAIAGTAIAGWVNVRRARFG